jgi:two-component system sensor histidine kinase/response regulator
MKKFNILVIDGNEGSRTMLEEILIANDYAVKTADSGKNGAKILMEETVDLIFIDADMAKKESFLICQSIKEDLNFVATPVIFVVGRDDLAVVQEIYESGGGDYILKPLIWSELLIKARVHLELKYSRKMAKSMNQILENKVAQRTFELEDSLKNLRQAQKELEILEIAKSEFLNLISHEIRTPLNGILGSMALIGRYNFTDEVNRYFSLLDTSVKRLEKFSNTILEASNLRMKGSKALKISETDLFSIIQSAIDECIAKFSQKGIEIELQNHLTNSFIKGDHQYLKKCFTAVLDNAFKFSPKGDKIQIRLNFVSDGYVSITITDRGKGFSKGSLDNIYSALSNLEAHFDQNTGMGLHLAKLIVDAHSGFIKVGNIQPKGATIQIMLPSR